MSFILSFLSSFDFSFSKKFTPYEGDIESTLTQYEKNFYGSDSDSDSDTDSSGSDSYFSKHSEFMPCKLDYVVINIEVDNIHYLGLLV